jgi:hypothetical protein
MNKEKHESHIKECNCDKLEIRDSIKGNCSKEQILKCHGEKQQ